MRLKNTSPLGDLDVPVLGRIVRRGEEVEVPDEIAERFTSQRGVWQATAPDPGAATPPESTTAVPDPAVERDSEEDQ